MIIVSAEKFLKVPMCHGVCSECVQTISGKQVCGKTLELLINCTDEQVCDIINMKTVCPFMKTKEGIIC